MRCRTFLLLSDEADPILTARLPYSSPGGMTLEQAMALSGGIKAADSGPGTGERNKGALGAGGLGIRGNAAGLRVQAAA